MAVQGRIELQWPSSVLFHARVPVKFWFIMKGLDTLNGGPHNRTFRS